MSFDVLIVGAGISGAIIARKLALINKKILIIEKRSHVAGNIYDEKIENIFVHKYGPHIFHTDDEEAYEYMSKFWTLNGYKNKVQANIDNKLIPIPFNFKGIDIFFPKDKKLMKEKLIKEFGKDSRISIFDLMNTKDKMIKRVADFVYTKIFENYTIKMWGISPKDLGDDVMKRVPVVISYSERYFRNKYEGIPVMGYTNAIEKIIDHSNITLKLNVDALSLLKFKNDKIYYKNKIFKGLVIYSGPLDQIMNFKYGHLPYRSLFIDFKTLNVKEYQKTAVVNFPNHPKITRITEYKKMCNAISDKTIISIETPGEYNINSKYFSTPYYPLTINEGKNMYLKYKNDLSNYKNFFPIGRLATFQYINMDRAVKLALDLSAKLINRIKDGK